MDFRAVLENRGGLVELLVGFNNPFLLEDSVGFHQMLDEFLALFFGQIEEGLLVGHQFRLTRRRLAIGRWGLGLGGERQQQG